MRKLVSDHVYKKEHHLVLTRKLDEPFPYRRLSIKGLVVSVCDTPEDFNVLCVKYPDRVRNFQEHRENGQHAVIGRIDGELVAYVWIATDDFYDALYLRTFEVEPRQIYQFAGYVDPEFRGKPVGLLVMDWVNTAWHGRGYEKTLAAVSADNTASVKFHAKLRYVPNGKAFDFYKFLWIKWSRTASPRADALAAYDR
ncbi:MAG: GNAT family N-acetyltransferase [Pseudomonadota bacterium]